MKTNHYCELICRLQMLQLSAQVIRRIVQSQQTSPQSKYIETSEKNKVHIQILLINLTDKPLIFSSMPRKLKTETIDSHNQKDGETIFIEKLDLNFCSSKELSSQRSHNSLSHRKNNEHQHSDKTSHKQIQTQRKILIEKKKNYSETVRERNLQNKGYKTQIKNNDQSTGSLLHNKSADLKENQSISFEPQTLKNRSGFAQGSSVSNSCKRIPSSSFRKPHKSKKLQINTLELEPIPHVQIDEENEYYCPFISKLSSQDAHSVVELDSSNCGIKKKEADTSVQSYASYGIRQPKMGKKKVKNGQMKLCPQTISELLSVRPTRNYAKELSVLQRQNHVYQRDISQLSRENKQVRSELEDAKGYIEELKIKAEQLLQSSMRMTLESIEGFNSTRRQSEEVVINIQEEICSANLGHMIESVSPEHNPIEQNKEEIIDQLRAELAVFKNLNSALELKLCMSQKKIVEEANMLRKKMAKQVSMWREKFTKMRNQNIKIKALREMSISMEISGDEDP